MPYSKVIGCKIHTFHSLYGLSKKKVNLTYTFLLSQTVIPIFWSWVYDKQMQYHPLNIQYLLPPKFLCLKQISAYKIFNLLIRIQICSLESLTLTTQTRLRLIYIWMKNSLIMWGYSCNWFCAMEELPTDK